MFQPLDSQGMQAGSVQPERGSPRPCMEPSACRGQQLVQKTASALACSCSTELLFSVVGSCHLRLRCAMLRKESRSNGCRPEASTNRAGTCARRRAEGRQVGG